MDYEVALDFIKECTKFGQKLGLERITELLKRLGNPETKFRSIHVAGTNGKGSTVAMFDAVLQQAHYRTGRYTSPHLSSYRERFLINQTAITKAQLAAMVTLIQPIIKSIIQDGFGAPTEFEVGTAIAFTYFAQQQVEVALVEVGMGGRFDATNVITPVLSVITHIALDHQQYLGNTLAEIAFEKAGIIKPGVGVVIGCQEPEISQYLQELTCAKNAPFGLADQVEIKNFTITEKGTEIAFTKTCFGELNLHLNLLGRHQVYNCLNVIAAIPFLLNTGIKITVEQLQKGLAKVTWPSRGELIQLGSSLKLYFDGAHNPDGAIALVEMLETIYPGTRFDFLIGILNNRPLAEMAQIFAPVTRRVIVTTVPDPKSALPRELGDIFLQFGVTTIIEPEPVKALELLLQTDNQIVVVTGSLYLTGLLRSILLKTGD